MGSYRTLRAWQVTHQLGREVMAVTRGFPAAERFELTSQLRRAATSAPANRAEGNARLGPRELLRHSRIAASSLAEIAYWLLLAREEGYLDKRAHQRLERLRREASFDVYGLIQPLHKRDD
jgi:four helix bundle protein